MDCVIIGPSDKTVLFKDGTLKKRNYDAFIEEYANFLAKKFDNIIIAPDDGVYRDIALAFSKVKGKKPIAYYPDKDEFYGIDHIKHNFDDYDIRPIDGDWYKLNAELTKRSNIIICVGFTPGVLVEISYIKYHQKYAKKDIKLFIDNRCIKNKLPGSFDRQIKDIRYFNDTKDLNSMIP